MIHIAYVGTGPGQVYEDMAEIIRRNCDAGPDLIELLCPINIYLDGEITLEVELNGRVLS